MEKWLLFTFSQLTKNASSFKDFNYPQPCIKQGAACILPSGAIPARRVSAAVRSHRMKKRLQSGVTCGSEKTWNRKGVRSFWLLYAFCSIQGSRACSRELRTQSEPPQHAREDAASHSGQRLPQLIDEIEGHLLQQTVRPPQDASGWMQETAKLELYMQAL